jgi:osmotically-inducible protein OsmY
MDGETATKRASGGDARRAALPAHAAGRPYAIHIIVKNGRTMLLVIVDGAADRQIAEVRAREGTGVFEVENSLTVLRSKRSAR